MSLAEVSSLPNPWGDDREDRIRTMSLPNHFHDWPGTEAVETTGLLLSCDGEHCVAQESRNVLRSIWVPARRAVKVLSHSAGCNTAKPTGRIPGMRFPSPPSPGLGTFCVRRQIFRTVVEVWLVEGICHPIVWSRFSRFSRVTPVGYLPQFIP